MEYRVNCRVVKGRGAKDVGVESKRIQKINFNSQNLGVIIMGLGFWGFGEQYVTVPKWASYVLLPKTPKPLKDWNKI